MSVRGLFTINSRTFAVAQDAFGEVFSNETFVLYGTVSNDSQPVSMAASGQQLLIASGGFVYLLNLGSNVLSQIPAANFDGPISQVGYCDGFFLALQKESNRFYVSGLLDATDWTTNGASLVSVFPDNLVSMLVDHREIWFWSKTKAVVYYDSGNVFPFDVVPSAYIEQGTKTLFSPIRLDNTIFWLGADDRGHNMVWRATGYTPQRVSNHAIEHAMQRDYPTVDDAIGYGFQMDGHSFYHLYFPTANKSWRYDVSTGMWHEVMFWNTTYGREEAHHSQCHTFNFGKHLVGDWSSNKIYDMEIPTYVNGVWDFATDDGGVIRRVRRASHISKEQKFMAHHQIQIYMETGLGPIPPLVGSEAPTSYILEDDTSALWAMGINDTGVLTTTAGASGTAQTLFLNDSDAGTSSWEVTVNDVGVLNATAVTFNAAYPTTLRMVDNTGTGVWTLTVNDVGVLATTPGGTVERPPQLSVRWSDDAAHTWSNEYIIDVGKAGEFSTRVMKRRLGRARDRVYEVSMSDPIGWRLISGYLEVGNITWPGPGSGGG